MRNPLRSEEDAFRATIWIATLALPVAVAALVFDAGVALGVAAGMGFAGLVVYLRRRRDEQSDETVEIRRAGDERHRILVIANETLSGRALRDEIAYRASEGDKTDIRVVCPALNTRVKHWASDEDSAKSDAARRLEEVLGTLRQMNLEADGEVGADDPVLAIEDALCGFPADEIIISTHPLGRSNWLETEVIARSRRRFPVPITHVLVDLEREQEFVAERD